MIQSPYNFSSPEVKLMVNATCKAAHHLWEASEAVSKLTVTVKKDQTIVLNLDLELQAIILSMLGSGLPIVAEEEEASHKLISSTTPFFTVDPLDGTTSCKRFLSSTGGQVGFGPLLGLYAEGKLQAATFFHSPLRRLFVAVLGRGLLTYQFVNKEECLKDLHSEHFTQQKNIEKIPLSGAGLLFFPGVGGETDLVKKIKELSLVENVYRFGGFANDCARLAMGYEQLHIQFSVKAWDLPAALFPYEAGSTVLMNPLKEKTPLNQWRVQENNPLITMLPDYFESLVQKKIF